MDDIGHRILHEGDKVVRVPEVANIDDRALRRDHVTRRSYEATVVYLHPLGRFHVVEFVMPSGNHWLESYQGVYA